MGWLQVLALNLTNSSLVASLTLPEPTLTPLRTVGIRCDANLTVQRRDQDWLIRGQESGGAVNDIGRYVNFCKEDGSAGQIVGIVFSPDGPTFLAALWQHGQNGAVKNLGTLPGDFAALATGINSRGQVVGSTMDSNFNWSHGFIWQNDVMTDLNTLLPADSNLFITMANKINERGQISGMATVLSGPHAGDVHAILATPVNASIGTSVADVARTHPNSNLPANVGQKLLQRFKLGRFAQ